MKYARTLLVATLVSCSSVVTQAAEPGARVAAAILELDDGIEKKRAEFAKVRGGGDEKAWVKSKLQHMVDVDQFVRSFAQSRAAHTWPPDESTRFNQELVARMMKVDAQHTADLKAMLVRWRWFTIPEFDELADRNAWLLVQHADRNPEFQRRVLATLEPLAKTGETSARNYAYLHDRVVMSFDDPSARGLQRYGTQGMCTAAGEWEPFPMEEPEKVDERRRAVGLEPMAEYKPLFKDLCH